MTLLRVCSLLLSLATSCALLAVGAVLCALGHMGGMAALVTVAAGCFFVAAWPYR